MKLTFFRDDLPLQGQLFVFLQCAINHTLTSPIRALYFYFDLHFPECEKFNVNNLELY